MTWRQARPTRRIGASASGMEYTAIGDGPRALLTIPGGPGSDVPTGLQARLSERQYAGYLDAGYTVWTATRPRHMPPGHTVIDMAADYARFAREEIGGPVDVLGESYGGIIAIHLAAGHPDVLRRVVVAGAAATVSAWGSEVDARWARQRAEGRHSEAGATSLEYIIDGPRWAPVRRAVGPIAGRLFASSDTPPGDLLVEVAAEKSYDATDVLERIAVPVLVACGAADRFFPVDEVRATAARIPNCSLILYPGLGHVRALSSPRLYRDALEFLTA